MADAWGHEDCSECESEARAERDALRNELRERNEDATYWKEHWEKLIPQISLTDLHHATRSLAETPFIPQDERDRYRKLADRLWAEVTSRTEDKYAI